MIASINQILNLTELPPITLLYGQEDFLIEKAYHQITAKFLQNDPNHYNFEEIDASEKEIDINYIIDMVSSVPMLGGNRIITIKNFNEFFKGRLDKKKNAGAPIAKYFNNPNPSTNLILLAKEKSIDGAVKKQQQFDKAISAAKFPYHILLEKHLCVEFPKVWENELPKYVIEKFNELNKNIDLEAVNLLLSRTNPELRQLNNEIEKIDIFYNNKNEISADDINAVIGSSRSFNVFELQRAVGQKKLNDAIYILNQMMSESKQEMLIISMLTRYFIAVWKISELGKENLNKFQLAGKVGVSPAFIYDYQKAAKNYSQKELNRVFVVLADTDEELKSSSIDALSLLQNMLINIIG